MTDFQRNQGTTTAAGRRAFFQSAALGIASMAAAQTQTSEKKLRIGLVGVGGRGNGLGSNVLRLISQGYPVEIAAVCDIYQPRLERAEVRFKAKGYKNTADMLKETPLDAVLIATPDRHHLYNLREAIRAGKDVYCEKPLCHWSQFDLLKSVVHENRTLKRMVQVGSQYISDSMWAKTGDLISQGAIGKPVHIQVPNFRHDDFGERGMRVDDPNAKDGVGVDWAKFQADAPRREFSVARLFQWRMFMEYAGGPLPDVGVHNMSPIYKMLRPGFPSKVVATGGRFYFNHERTVPDTMDVLIQYPQNFTVAILETFVNDQVSFETVIRGTEASVVFPSTEGPTRGSQEGVMIVPLVRRTSERGVPPPKPPEPRLVPSDNYAETVAAAQGGRRRYVDHTQAHIKNFLEAVRTREQPSYDLELGYQVHVPICMAMRSLLENKVALFNPNREDIRMS